MFLKTNHVSTSAGRAAWYLNQNLDAAAEAKDFSLAFSVRPVDSTIEIRSDRIFIDPVIVSEIFGPPIAQVVPQRKRVFRAGVNRSRPGMEAGLTAETLGLRKQARPILTYLVNELRAGTKLDSLLDGERRGRAIDACGFAR